MKDIEEHLQAIGESFEELAKNTEVIAQVLENLAINVEKNEKLLQETKQAFQEMNRKAERLESLLSKTDALEKRIAKAISDAEKVEVEIKRLSTRFKNEVKEALEKSAQERCSKKVVFAVALTLILSFITYFLALGLIVEHLSK